MAYDEKGHRVIALIANHYLTPEVRKKVNELLLSDTDVLASRDIAGAATWASRYMNSDKYTTRERYEGTRHWHFAQIFANRPNIPEACFGQVPLPTGTPASKGPPESCVIDKIDQFRAELSNPMTEPAERLLALKFLLHLVGDIHEPMHVQDQHNDFGRLIPVKAEDRSITPGTLYGYWNEALVRRQGSDEAQVAERLIAAITPADRELWSGQVTHFWALEAHQLGVDYANGTMLGNYSPMDNSYLIAPEELRKAEGIVQKQLSKAGYRLALLLNAAFNGEHEASVVYERKYDVRAGRTLAENRCAVCHVVTGQSAGTSHETTAPDFTSIANTRGMSPNVLREFLLGPHPTMPYLTLSDKEVNDSIDYILSLKMRD